MISGPERRRSPRFLVDVPIVLSVAGETRPARLRDVCRDAALVETERALAIETEVGLTLDLGRVGRAFEVSGRVIRLAPGAHGSHGVAILFSSLSSEAEARIDDFVAVQEQG
jgi:hypothetical protein